MHLENSAKDIRAHFKLSPGCTEKASSKWQKWPYGATQASIHLSALRRRVSMVMSR
ncbi:hypothetical protein PROFUN_07031 [Planoprotostelium fungivorum]|uniref:Uncharacterized protein n=1 Tax=Planoprotostelium fungivorum TaxID=1890364 RepID=A0A2P6NMT4_9EUKA|nr:hypothetical protein PROFUN_07031 [Planoprotostelium fungivorum]